MKAGNSLRVVVRLGLILALAPAAGAQPSLNGTFGYTAFGTVSFTGAALGAATSITIPTGEIINALGSTYNGKPNDFYANPAPVGLALFDQVSVSPLTLALPPAVINGGAQGLNLAGYLTFGTSGQYTFTPDSISWTSAGANDLSFQMTGLFSDSTDHFADDDTAGLSGSFTQSTSGGQVNASFIWVDALVPAVVPEPPTTSLLGLFALGALVRRLRR